MSKHEFRLILEGIPEFTDEVMDALYEAGCDDGTFSQINGVTSAFFHREAPSLSEAINSAVHDVRRANIGARIVKVEIDVQEETTCGRG
jgi:hypothetical protein